MHLMHSFSSCREDPIGALVGLGDGRQQALSATRRHQRYETGFPIRRGNVDGWALAGGPLKAEIRLDTATHAHPDAHDKTLLSLVQSEGVTISGYFLSTYQVFYR